MKSHGLHSLAFVLFCVLSFASLPKVFAADLSLEGADLVKASLIADVDAIVPGSSFTLGVHLKMKSHWHTYWVNPGESGDATKIKLSGPAGVEFGKVQWPLPRAIESFGSITYGYEDEVLLLIPVNVSKEAKINGQAKIDVHVAWLACLETCIEGHADLSLSLPVGDSASKVNQKQFGSWREQIPKSESSAIKSIEQAKDAAGAAQATLVVEWNTEPRKVEWFPIGTPAVAIENVVVKHEGKRSVVTYKPTVYKPEQVPGGKVEGVIVFEDAKGQRQGVAMSFVVPIKE